MPLELSNEQSVLDDTTADALAFVRRTRRDRTGGRRLLGARVDDLWSALWTLAALLLILAGVLQAAPGLGRAIAWAGRMDVAAEQIGVGMAVTALGMTVAGWLGPVVLSPAEVTWLLPLPGDRGRLLRPRLVSALAAATGAGLTTGALATALARLHTGNADGDTLLAGLVAHVSLAWLVVCAGVLAECRPGCARVLRRCSGGLAAAGVTLTLLAVSVDLPRPLIAIAALSGPWGWAGWAIAGHTAGSAMAACITVAVAALIAVWWAVRSAGAISTGELTVRGRHSRQAAQGAFLLDLRGLTLVAHAVSQAGRRRARLRLPTPPFAWAIPLWRDTVVLLRHPGRLAVAGALLVAGILQFQGVLHWRHSADHPAVSPLTATALGFFLTVPLHLAAVALAEPAYQDTDHTRRALLLPFSPASLAVAHFAVPTLALSLGGGGAAAVALAAGGSPSLHTALVAYLPVLSAAAPAVIGAALVGAYRGAPRYDLLALSADWYGALPFLFWRTAPMLAAVFVVAPWLWHALVVFPEAFHLSAAVALVVRSALVCAWSLWRVTRQAQYLNE
ncbi:DUF6297 family protein [Streptomyces sp. NPDC051104]|uniref:DUF6297 family protein n=1 Tax=Streptomyces sp. NPDC051104 TaxID=3155044 RepID=UPI0034309A00